MSKGSRRRPCQVSRSEEEARWEAAFGKRNIPTVMPDSEREALLAERDQLAQEQERNKDE